MLNLENSYAQQLRGLYLDWQGAKLSSPHMVQFNSRLAEDLGLPGEALNSVAGALVLSGSEAPKGSSPLAMAYSGHQFGNFAPELGDGRALLLGEHVDGNGKRFDIHLKGSGRTPFSRGGDGKAALGPVLREYLISEAMHALGIPTTRALAAIATGETIDRGDPQPGAVLARVAASHIRVGTFQFFAVRGEYEKVKRLADYTIARHFPEIEQKPDRYLKLLERVRDAQAALVAKWVLVGFVHGVMNTDNTAISGETLDYGPCAFIDTYDPNAVFSSIDWFGRYAYGQQPVIAQWNLARFAETLVELIDPDDAENAMRLAANVVNAFPLHYQREWLSGMRAKLGLLKEDLEDLDLANSLHAAMEGNNVDFTNLFRNLPAAAQGQPDAARALFSNPEKFDEWVLQWRRRFHSEDVPADARLAAMNLVNPLYIPRNHKVEEALTAAIEGDIAPFVTLLGLVQRPYEAVDGRQDYAKPAPPNAAPHRTFCGT